MRKILSVLAAIGLTSTAASAVVACGNKDSSEVTKTDLSSVPMIKALESKLTINGTADMGVDDAYASFSNISGVKEALAFVNLGEADFEFVLTVPSYVADGSLKITVKSENSKYSGSLNVKISQLVKAELSSVSGLTTTISGSSDMNETNVLNTFLAVEGNQGLQGEVEVKAGSFEAPGTETEGSFILEAIAGNHKYTGSITVVIEKLSDNSTKVKSLSTNDDHKTTVITLSTEDSLRLGYIKKEGDKYVAGDKLPNGPLTTKIGESTITATFTPNFENGTVQVLLTIDTPSVDALSTNDDHKTTVITLSTQDSLRLGYIKKEGDKYVAGDKLPNGPLTTKIGESTITATFTPNFENGTVQVLLTIDTPTNN